VCVCARACVRVCMHTVSVSLCDLHCRRCALEFARKNRESARMGARADCTPGDTRRQRLPVGLRTSKPFAAPQADARRCISLTLSVLTGGQRAATSFLTGAVVVV